MAIRLKQAGIDDFVIWERDAEVGGTWWANTYPGCQCDIPSHLYSFSFAPNPDWSRTYPLQPELRRYLRECTDRYGVRDHIRLDCEVTGAEWDEDEGVWRVETAQGPFTVDLLIAAPGFLSEPATPALPGLEDFEGETVPHGALEPRPRPHRPPRRGDRHRRLGDPDRPADPADRRAPRRLPAHAALGHAASRPSDHRFRAAPLPPLPGAAAGRPHGRLLQPRDAGARASSATRS